MRTLKRALLCGAVTAATWTSSLAAAADLDGLYLMTRFWPGSGLEVAAYAFQNGAVVINPMASGKLDPAAERAIHPKQVGTYKMQGGQLVVTMDGAVHQSKFEPESKGCFGWDAGVFCPVDTFKPGQTLEGTFSGGASVGGGAGAVTSSTAITFSRDGTYTRESVGTIASRTSSSTVTGGSMGSERGKYHIEGAALHMMPDGGKETVVSTFPYDDGSKGPAPRSVYFGGAMLKRVR